MAGGWDSLDPTYNEVTPGSVQPSGGMSVAAMATGSGKRGVTAAGSNSPGSPAPGAGTSVDDPSGGNFIVGMIVFVVLLLVVMFIAHRFGGDEGDFKNIKGSAYNVLFIALVAVTGIPVVKIALYKLSDFGVPGANHLLQWAKAA